MTPVWITIGTAVVAAEVWALVRRRPEDTLSAHIRRWLGIEPERPWKILGQGFVLVFCAWLSLHLSTGWV